jgi:hypothetical protein
MAFLFLRDKIKLKTVPIVSPASASVISWNGWRERLARALKEK